MRGMRGRGLRQQRPGPPPAAERSLQEGPSTAPAASTREPCLGRKSSDHKPLTHLHMETWTGYTTATVQTPSPENAVWHALASQTMSA